MRVIWVMGSGEDSRLPRGGKWVNILWDETRWW